MYDSWEELEASIMGCKNCKLSNNRKNIVLGYGNKNADIMFIGDGPGVEEDFQGNPFVGKAGQLMNKAFEGLGINKSDLYITNILKCKMDYNKVPEDEEYQTCLNYLRNQVILIKPKIIVLLGSVALKNILGKEYGIINVRGTWIEKKGILYMPTWHPVELLRDEDKKIEFWNDLSEVINKQV